MAPQAKDSGFESRSEQGGKMAVKCVICGGDRVQCRSRAKEEHKLDDMVTIAKMALEEISEIGKGKVQAIALAALLKIERAGK